MRLNMPGPWHTWSHSPLIRSDQLAVEENNHLNRWVLNRYNRPSDFVDQQENVLKT